MIVAHKKNVLKVKDKLLPLTERGGLPKGYLLWLNGRNGQTNVRASTNVLLKILNSRGFGSFAAAGVSGYF